VKSKVQWNEIVIYREQDETSSKFLWLLPPQIWLWLTHWKRLPTFQNPGQRQETGMATAKQDVVVSQVGMRDIKTAMANPEHSVIPNPLE
jgi:hypothetical protein